MSTSEFGATARAPVHLAVALDGAGWHPATRPHPVPPPTRRSGADARVAVSSPSAPATAEDDTLETTMTTATPRDATGGPDTARQLLDGLEALVQRHRALANDDAAPLHAELITAEVAMQLALARRSLRHVPGPAR